VEVAPAASPSPPRRHRPPPEFGFAADGHGLPQLGVEVVVDAAAAPDGQPVLAAQRQRHETQRDVRGDVEDETQHLPQRQALQRPGGRRGKMRGKTDGEGGKK